MSTEGWDASHDDGHDNCELVRAAVVYARVAYLGFVYSNWFKDWPWEPVWFKPGTLEGERWTVDAQRCLAKAGALIAAEMDRRQRFETNEKIGAALERLAP